MTNNQRPMTNEEKLTQAEFEKFMEYANGPAMTWAEWVAFAKRILAAEEKRKPQHATNEETK